mgnify:CR=1 FL=1
MKKKFLIPLVLLLGLSSCSFPSFPLKDADKTENKDDNKDDENKDSEGVTLESFATFIKKFETEGCSYKMQQKVYSNDEMVEVMEFDYMINLVKSTYYSSCTEYVDDEIYTFTNIILDGLAFTKNDGDINFNCFKVNKAEILRELEREQLQNEIIAIPSKNLTDYTYNSSNDTYGYSGTLASPIGETGVTYTYNLEFSFDFTGKSTIKGDIIRNKVGDSGSSKVEIEIRDFEVGAKNFDFPVVGNLANKSFKCVSFDFDLEKDTKPSNDELAYLKSIAMNYIDSTLEFSTEDWEWEIGDLVGSYFEGGTGTYFEPLGFHRDGEIIYSDSVIDATLSRGDRNRLVLSYQIPGSEGMHTIYIMFAYAGTNNRAPMGLSSSGSSGGGSNSGGPSFDTGSNDIPEFDPTVFPERDTSKDGDNFVDFISDLTYKGFELTLEVQMSAISNAKQVSHIIVDYEDFNYLNESVEIVGDNEFFYVDGVSGDLYEYRFNSGEEHAEATPCSFEHVEEQINMARNNVRAYFPTDNFNDYVYSDATHSYRYNKTNTITSGNYTYTMAYDLYYNFDFSGGVSVEGYIVQALDEDTKIVGHIEISDCYAGRQEIEYPIISDLDGLTLYCYEYEIVGISGDRVYDDDVTVEDLAFTFLDSSISFTDGEFSWEFDSKLLGVIDKIIGTYSDFDNFVIAYTVTGYNGEEVIDVTRDYSDIIYRLYDREIVYRFIVDDGRDNFYIDLFFSTARATVEAGSEF